MPTLVRIDDALTVRDGRLHVEGCDATDLARRFGTPLYVTSEDQILRNLATLREAFATRWPGAIEVLPSIKANAALAVRRVLSRAGTGCDAFGAAELEAALRGGVAPERISLNGPAKSRSLIETAVGLGVRITLDSVRELALAREAAHALRRAAHVRLRLRPDYVTLTAPSELLPGEGSIRRAAGAYKAGIPTEDLLALPPNGLASDENLVLRGLHVHLGRHSAEPATWTGMADAYLETIARLLERHPELPIDELDIGGGLPAPRDPFGRAAHPAGDDRLRPRVPPLAAYAEAIAPRLVDGLTRLGRDPASVTLELEPGRALFADAGVHLTTVLGVKRETVPEPRRWVETDTSDAWVPDVVLEGNRWTVLAAGRADAPTPVHADVVGTTCAPDIIVAAEPLPELEPGDVLAILDTGAYQEAAASNFNSLPRPGTVLVSGAHAELVRRPETVADVFARDIVPARLTAASAEGAGGAEGHATALDHVSVTVTELDRSIAFYRDVLGLAVRERGEEADTDLGQIAGLPGAHVRWADLLLPDGHVLELLEYVAPSAPPLAPAPNRAGGGHLCLRVPDVATAHARLRAAGHEPVSAPVPVTGSVHWEGARCFYVRDPDGAVVEILEWSAGRAR